MRSLDDGCGTNIHSETDAGGSVIAAAPRPRPLAPGIITLYVHSRSIGRAMGHRAGWDVSDLTSILDAVELEGFLAAARGAVPPSA